jgi:hypothetical protein
MNQTLGMNPAQRVQKNVKLGCIVTDDYQVPAQTIAPYIAKQGAFSCYAPMTY